MKIFYALSIFLSITISASSQDRGAIALPEAAARIVKFYPNPATSYINFEFQKTSDKTYNFQIFNFLGKKVFELNNVNPKTTVNLTDFFRGVYIFQLRDKNGKVIDSGKFQVSK